MPAPANPEPKETDEERAAREHRSLVQRASAYLREKLPAASGFALKGSIAAGMLVAAGAALADPASSLSNTELVKLMQGLGVNWLASLVWEWRSRGGKVDAAEQARLIEAQLGDQNLAKLFEQLELIKTTLAALKTKVERDAWAREVLQRGTLQPNALQAAAHSVNVSFSQGVYDSAVLTAGGNIENVTINVNGARTVLNTAVYRAELSSKLAGIDLQTTDGALREKRLEVANVYTPLTVFTGRHKAPANDDPLKSRVGPSLDDEQPDSEYGPGSLVAYLNDTPRAVVLGDPGSGKSTVLSYLALGLAGMVTREDEDFVKHWTHRNQLPVHIVLRRFAVYAREHAKPGQRPHAVLLDYAAREIAALSGEAGPALSAHLRQLMEEHGVVWLLDGLDEVSSDDRRNLVKPAIESLVETYKRCRYVVTCRGYSYVSPRSRLAPPGMPFETTSVLPFSLEQMQYFVQRYYAEIGALEGVDKAPRAAKLVQALHNRRTLARMGANPLLLALIVALHNYARKELPNDRVELLSQAVDLLLSRWQLKKDEDDPRTAELSGRVSRLLADRPSADLLDVLAGVAYRAHSAMHAANGGEDDESATADIAEDDLRKALLKFLEDEDDIKPDNVIAYLRERAGLLVDAGGADEDDAAAEADRKRSYKFPHRLIQEFLAARHVRNEYLEKEVAARLNDDWARWKEVFALAALSSGERPDTLMTYQLLLDGDLSTPVAALRATLQVELWADKVGTRHERAVARRMPDQVQAHIEATRQRAQKLIETPQLLTPRERNDMARRLLELPLINELDRRTFVAGDTRLAACANLATPEGLTHYLAEGFVLLQPKPFRMQGDYETQIKAPLLLSKTQLTWAQFEPFVEQGGYADETLWTTEGRKWRGKRIRPRFWDDLDEHIANHPANGLSWFESMAWCAWLTRKLQESDVANPVKRDLGKSTMPVCRLLTEEEWEYAARGDALREWPWKRDGSDRWVAGDELRCNMSDTGLGRTSAAGLFPDGATPEGIVDLSGNVWEWGLSAYAGDPRKAQHDEVAKGSRVLRGGAFYYNRQGVSASFRRRYGPVNLDSGHFVGCRVCLSPLGASRL